MTEPRTTPSSNTEPVVGPPDECSLFVALSRFTVADGRGDDVRRAFAARPGCAESVPGFVRMQVLCPDDVPDEFWQLTYWTDPQAYRDWHRSDAFRASRRALPEGLQLVQGSREVKFFRQVAT